MAQYGVLWSDGTFTGAITDKLSLAHSYAHKTGTTYEVGKEGDPELLRKRAQDEQTYCAERALDLANTKPTAPQEEDFSDLC